MSTWVVAAPRWWPGWGWLRRPLRGDFGPVERFLWGFWVFNVALFACLVPPTLLLGHAGWPLRLAAAAGLLGAGVWEAAALRAGRFPLWADVLETLTVALLAWRYPAETDAPLILFVLTFALAGLGFRVLFGSPWQAVARTVTMLAAIVACCLLSVGGHDPRVLLDRTLPVLLPTAGVAVVSGLVMRMPAVVAHGRQAARKLNTELLAANSRADVHAAIVHAVVDLLGDSRDVRVIVWDDDVSGLQASVQPSMAAGYRAAEVRSRGDQPASPPRWMREPILAGESVYREALDDEREEELRQAFGFDPITGAILFVPLHRGHLQMLSVASRHPIHALENTEIEHLARVAETTLGSMELTEQLRSSQDALHQRSYYDPLTHLANRELLGQRLQRALDGSDRHRSLQVGLLLLDLDHFTTINDLLGQPAGDEALVEIARRLTACAQPGDTVARLGDDEFAILLDGVDDPTGPERVARRLIEALDAPLTSLAGNRADVFVRASIGLAVSGPAAHTPQDLLTNANLAMRAAKTAGGAAYRVYDPAMRAATLGRLELESDLNRALERGELVVHYQPVIDLANGTISGVEALVRWQHPRRGMIPPARFIPVAEDTGVIGELGAWVLREACQQLRAWSAADPKLGGLRMGVNLSPRQLAEPDLPRTIGRILAESGVDPGRVILELTESALVEHTDATLSTLNALKALGLRLAVDDFGTGFSSLGYLRRFPFDRIKIDRAFVERVDVDDDAAALTRAIIRMADALGLGCIAEGVETSGQADWLRAAGCALAQGYLFAAPMPPDRLRPLLTSELPWSPRRR
jgi:diguanylate cyclase (GGDEF)-like protein